ncbi:tRNA (adenosine(37)-N6)-dimethylallyltransferase MiaA [Macrococcoides canis]|uniref:tRNA dimethylallyltransferase n=1 Tax=Macrococcoides canis TaxID=1855823 RepID=A0AAE6X1H5_9STAP|nr:tRNA (adenosine(37)-N6)-dimethylallyltransferase MiaA [Macrococcus canis]MCO4096286.1 tRNA (adenosine(37)-N6)-dimethylallyltransferase MiaA [Macrococcus canis]QCT74731.1 tRNA (adenosine(37)-N6)-dimethylallyltransferase MiaA [Macrococcus canis]QIH78248.1 tRNA (adenosine(37)-N6)-dimethylallyltransferase MiaA [Macrococcus canis]QNR07750.1 tRNA (adenosine(37)-N6)-dimethylallyltransferase MiaA [Macrococcus canis]QTQ09197.1 tRNA (adenosine(37)-N6)-dimethylallyltransferase MiaA [Macrococcus canis]
MNKIPLIVIVGPTAVGKTALSIEVAKAVNGEIISGDAIQVYRGMDIGSAKITHEEMEGIPHHLIDILDPDEAYSAAQFKAHAEKLIEDIYSRGKTPMIVGGTGLYIQSILYEYEFVEEDNALKKDILCKLEQYNKETLYAMLKDRDPKAAAQIHMNNRQRVLRALTYYEMHHKSITDQKKSQTLSSKYDTFIIGLNMPRPILYDRINHRVLLMIEQGLVQEVSTLLSKGYREKQSMTAIGYKEIIPYIDGEVSLNQAVESLQQNSRNFAKRQLTWFNNQMKIDWFDTDDLSVETITDQIMTNIKGNYNDKFR